MSCHKCPWHHQFSIRIVSLYANDNYAVHKARHGSLSGWYLNTKQSSYLHPQPHLPIIKHWCTLHPKLLNSVGALTTGRSARLAPISLNADWLHPGWTFGHGLSRLCDLGLQANCKLKDRPDNNLDHHRCCHHVGIGHCWQGDQESWRCM